MKQRRWMLMIFLMGLLWSLEQHVLGSQPEYTTERETDGLPKIRQIFAGYGGHNFKRLVNPHDYIVVGTNAVERRHSNVMTCLASGAEDILWEYRKEGDHNWTEELGGMGMKNISFPHIQGEDMVYREINDAYVPSEPQELIKLNGYYRCVAFNRRSNSRAHSQPVKLLIPFYVQYKNDGTSTLNVEPIPLTKTLRENTPALLECLSSDVGIYSKSPQVFVSADFQWVILKGKFEAIPYQPHMADSSRVRFDPTNGNLYFAYVTANDGIPRTVDGEVQKLICTATIGSTPRVTVAVLEELRIESNNEDPIYVEIIHPEYRYDTNGTNFVVPNERPTCLSGRLCVVPVYFGGSSLLERGKFLSYSPNGTDITNQLYSGLWFTAPVSTKLDRYSVVHYNPVENIKFETLYIDVITKNLPELASKERFPEIQHVEVSSTIELICHTLYTTDPPKFCYNGKQITAGNPFFIGSVEGNKLVISNISKDDTCVIECENENEAGYFYASSAIKVFDRTTIVPTYTPLSNTVTNERANENDKTKTQIGAGKSSDGAKTEGTLFAIIGLTLVVSRNI